MGFTTRLELHSQATRLIEDVPDVSGERGTGLAPCLTPHSRGLARPPDTSIAPLDYNGPGPFKV